MRSLPCDKLKCCGRCRRFSAVKAAAQSGAIGSSQGAPGVRQPLPLLVSRRIAAARAAETRRRLGGEVGPPLFQDPYAALLAGWQRHEPSEQQSGESSEDDAVTQEGAELAAALDVITTAHVDRLLLNATAISAVNRITKGDYRQVVLLGDAMDTRPYRLPLAPGTAIFLVAPAEAHAAAQAALASEAAATIAETVAADAAMGSSHSGFERVGGSNSEMSPSAGAATQGPGQDLARGPPEAAGGGRRGGRSRSRNPGPRPPPGCLLRRVPLELQRGADFSSLADVLTSAGFRADRLSVWAVQGLAGTGLDQQDVVSLLAEAAHCAAYHSLLLGELPPMAEGEAANTLAECGLLGAPLPFGTSDSSYGRWPGEWDYGAAISRPQRWLFAAQQIRLSIAQMETYEAHRLAAEEADEDFFDNFS